MPTVGVALLTFFALSAATGCTDKTSLIVEVASPDLTVPTDVDTLRFEAVTIEGLTIQHGDAPYAEFPISEPWPHSLAILPGAAPTNAMVLVTVTGMTGGDFAVRRTVQTRFVPGATNRVVVQLTRSCLGVECDPGIDCVAGMCTNVVIPDAGMDTGVRDSSVPDTGPVDTGPRDTGTMDTGTMDTGPTDAGCPTAPEVCGGGDEDCDMRIDEGLPCPGALVISELATGGPTGGADEFVEIYNRTEYPIDIGGLEIEYQSSAGSTWNNRAQYPAGATIGAHGFYLVGSATYSRSVMADPGGGWATGMNRLGGHARIASGVTELDRFGWGTAMNPEGNAIPQAVDDAVNTYERKAVPTSDVGSMTTGADVARGNGHDTDDNRADFIERPTADPQNTASPAETP